MEMMLALAAEQIYPVDKLPKGSKVIGYEIYMRENGKLIGKGPAGSAAGALKQAGRHTMLGQTFDFAVIAMDGEHKIRMTTPYTMKYTGPVKAEV